MKRITLTDLRRRAKHYGYGRVLVINNLVSVLERGGNPDTGVRMRGPNTQVHLERIANAIRQNGLFNFRQLIRQAGCTEPAFVGALETWYDTHGELEWRDRLSAAWHTGNYGFVGTECRGTLQKLRNTTGGELLFNIEKLKKKK